MRVDFMIIGAQKCGTTSLAEQLASHPEIAFCRIKEPGFFNTTTKWQAELPDYHALYSPQTGEQSRRLYGEASTMYTFFPEWRETHHRLFDYNPDLKLIYIMRQPVERIISNYSHDVVRNLIKGQPEEVIFQHPNYINRSRYAIQLRPYLELFPRQNILTLIFEEYTADQHSMLTQIAQFLAIDPANFQDASATHMHKTVGEYKLKSSFLRKQVESLWFQKIRSLAPVKLRGAIRRSLSNKLDEKPFFSPQLKQDIWRLLEDDVCQVEAIVGKRLDNWRKGYGDL